MLERTTWKEICDGCVIELQEILKKALLVADEIISKLEFLMNSEEGSDRTALFEPLIFCK